MSPLIFVIVAFIVLVAVWNTKSPDTYPEVYEITVFKGVPPNGKLTMFWDTLKRNNVFYSYIVLFEGYKKPPTKEAARKAFSSIYHYRGDGVIRLWTVEEVRSLVKEEEYAANDPDRTQYIFADLKKRGWVIEEQSERHTVTGYAHITKYE
jgi:hypothetical protein